jgi:hypothetical protein
MVVGNEQASTEGADRAFHEAHMLVRNEHGNVRAFEQRSREADQYDVVRAYQLGHRNMPPSIPVLI